MVKKHLFLLFLSVAATLTMAQKYTNPIVYEDYSDPDVIRSGEHYWMTASSFHCWPGLPILHSYDLVNWEVVNHAIKGPIPGGTGRTVEHGNQVWAPSIREHKGIFYITWGDPDAGIYEVHTADPWGEWSEPKLIVEAKGYIDACPFWDEDGRTYIVHALARSRAGMKSVLLLTETDEQLTKIITPSKIIFDGHETQPTCEGPKMYKKDGWYYIFFPAGGVPTGWQAVIRSRSLDVFGADYDPKMWEERIVMVQGATKVNGPHQGGWVTTPSGEDWFIHFQDVGPLGRILHLQPMVWPKGEWPVIGEEMETEELLGRPVTEHKMPSVSKKQKALIKKNKKVRIGYFGSALENVNEWQWQAWRDEATVEGLKKGMLYSKQKSGNSLWDEQHMVLKKITGPDVQYTTQVIFRPGQTGDRLGFIVMGKAYAALELKKEDDGSISISSLTCENGEKSAKEKVEPLTGWIDMDGRDMVPLKQKQIFLRISIHSADALPDAGNDDKRVTAQFSYSTDGIHFTEAPGIFHVEPGKWIGAKVGFYCISESESEGNCKILSFQEVFPKKK